MLNFKTVNIIFFVVFTGFFLYSLSATIPGWIYILLVVVYFAIQAYGSAVLSSQFFLPSLCEGQKSSDSVAITFDDGPIAGSTDAILEILKSYDAKAAFFCIGNRVASNPALTQRIIAEGHLVGNHSYWHRATFDLQSSGKILGELQATDKAILDVVGVRPNLFRPPYGVTNPMLAKAVKTGGYETIGWSVRSFDTVIKDSVVLLNRITKSLKGGDIILLHDYGSATLTILPALLDHIKKLGLKIVRVDELLNVKAYV